jgi:hypothetical protein
MRQGGKIAGAVLLSAIALLAVPTTGSAASPKTVTVAAAEPSTGNCWFLYEASDPGDDWRPYAGWVYRDIPPFQLKVGDTLAFDAGVTNDHDTQVDIALARTVVSGSDQNAQPFTTVVNNAQTPHNPRGDDAEGDYEMTFTAQTAFDFPGGGLIIRISNPGPSFLPDQTCDGQLVGNDTSDSSGLFVERVFNDVDGVAPWDGIDTGPLAQFRLVLFPTANQVKIGKLIRKTRRGTALLPLTVKGPGTLTVSGKGIKTRTAVASGAGKLTLAVKPKGKLRKHLNSRGRARVALRVGFVPGGDPPGDPSSKTRVIKLVKRP